jgi:hypothetical protein
MNDAGPRRPRRVLGVDDSAFLPTALTRFIQSDPGLQWREAFETILELQDKTHMPSVDVMMLSVAEVYRSLAMGVILTEMGRSWPARHPRFCAGLGILQRVVPIQQVPRKFSPASPIIPSGSLPIAPQQRFFRVKQNVLCIGRCFDAKWILFSVGKHATDE